MMKSLDQKISYYTDKFQQMGDHSKMAVLFASILIIGVPSLRWMGAAILVGIYLANRQSSPSRGVELPPGQMFDRESHTDLSTEKLDLLENLAEEYNIELRLLEDPPKNQFLSSLIWDISWKGQAYPERNIVELEKDYIERAELHNIEHLALHEIGHCVLKDTGLINQVKALWMFSGEDGDAEKWAAKHFTGTKEQYYELHAQTYYTIKVGDEMFPWLKEERSDWF